MNNISMFDYMYEDFKIDKPIRLIELFAGVGSQAMALRNLGADFEHHKVVEFDKYAIASYNAIHETNFETTDITKVKGEDLEIVDADKYEYIMTYSFPCQDLSVAGKGQGMAKGSGTRSGLLWEVERLLNEVEELPQVLLMENVPQVIGKKNIEHFNEWREFLESKGYTNFVDTLNAKNYGVAQNRNRTFMVSILGEYNYEFPRPIELTKVIADYLEPEVDEKFYINNEKADKLIEQLKGQLRNKQEGILLSEQATKVDKKTDVANTLLARDYKGFGNQPMNGVVEPIRLGGLYDTDKAKRQAGAVWDKDCISPTIDTMQGGNRQPMIVASRGRNPNNPSDRTVGSPTEQRLEPNSEGICNTITTVQKDNYLLEPQYRIRKLTPKECWRLMGFTDEDFHKAEQVNSNTQLYKQAGNSIVVEVLEGIFKQMLQWNI